MVKITRKQALEALRFILRPIASFCLRHSVPIQEVSDLFKRVFIEEAARFEGSEKTSISRIHVLTGIRRKEVSRLLKEQEEGVSAVRGTTLSRVLGLWSRGREYLDDDEKPKVLRADTNDFEKLVRKVTSDVKPAAVLASLKKVGAVEEIDGELRLKASAYEPGENLDESFDFLSRDIDDLVHIVEDNAVRKEGDPWLHSTTEFDNIPASEAQRIRGWLLRKGVQFQDAMRAYLGTLDRDLAGSEAGESEEESVRVMISCFGRVEEKNDDE